MSQENSCRTLQEEELGTHEGCQQVGCTSQAAVTPGDTFVALFARGMPSRDLESYPVGSAPERYLSGPRVDSEQPMPSVGEGSP